MEANTDLELTPMQPTDLDEVVSIEAASFASPWSRTMFLAEISNETAKAIVFKSKGKLVGYMCFWKVVDEAHLLNIAVHPMYRGRGLGTSMMGHLEALCVQEGLKLIILDVARRNVAGRRLYKKCGFKVIGFRKGYYSALKDDALIMEKHLEAGTVAGTASSG